MKKLIMMLVVTALTGCANLQFQWSASYQTEDLAKQLRAARQREVPPENVQIDVQRDATR